MLGVRMCRAKSGYYPTVDDGPMRGATILVLGTDPSESGASSEAPMSNSAAKQMPASVS